MTGSERRACIKTLVAGETVGLGYAGVVPGLQGSQERFESRVNFRGEFVGFTVATFGDESDAIIIQIDPVPRHCGLCQSTSLENSDLKTDLHPFGLGFQRVPYLVDFGIRHFWLLFRWILRDSQAIAVIAVGETTATGLTR